MKTWTVEVTLCVSYNLEADSQEDAEERALEMFDANDGVPFVQDSWEADTDAPEFDEAELVAEGEERFHAAELENFDPITILEKQEKTGELK